MKIFVVTHKECEIPIIDENFQILFVGSCLDGKKDYILDSMGDNISNKNRYYCELTGLYWIWKNCEDDMVGMCHYRRFFSKKYFSNSIKHFCDTEYFKSKLKTYDIIVPKKYTTKYILFKGYDLGHKIEDLKLTREIIEEDFTEYLNDFDFVINSDQLIMFNMFITKKEILDRYCEWLFNILFKLEEKSNYLSYNDYQQRVFGFIAERLFTIWIYHHRKKYKIKYQNVASFTHSFLFKMRSLLMKPIRKFRHLLIKVGNKNEL